MLAKLHNSANVHLPFLGTISYVAARYLMLFIGVFCFATIGFGQNILRGVITSDDELEKSFIEVELTDSTFRQIDYFVLNDKNFFEIKVDTSQQVVNLLVSALGCSPFFQRVDFSETKMLFLSVKLQNCTQELEEVVVRAERDFIREDGDTLTFDIEGFRIETDLTLGDILNRLPGIELTDNNQILYQGKRIKQIWVEGRDILNNQHSLAIESLQAADIEHVQIVHEYTPFHLRFSQAHSQDVAMNIGLIETARGKLNGKAEGALGTNEKFYLSAEAFRAKEDSGESIFLRSNNIGQAVIQPLEYLGLLPDVSAVGAGVSGEVEVIPRPLLPSARSLEENQYFLSTGADYNLGPKSRLKATVLGLWKSAQEEANIRTSFFDDSNTFAGASLSINEFPLFYGSLNSEHELSPDVLLSLSLTANLNRTKSDNLRTGVLGQAPYASSFAIDDQSAQYYPTVAVNLRHGDRWSSIHQVGAVIHTETLDRTFREEDASIPGYGQQLNNQQQQLYLHSTLENKRGIWLFEARNELEFGRLNTAILFEQLPEINNAQGYAYRWSNWQPSIRYGIKDDRWMTHLELELAHNGVYVEEQRFNRTWLNPLFRFKHSWSLTKFIGFSLRQEQAFIDHRNTFGLFQLYDNFQLVRYAVARGASSRVRAADVYFFNAQKDKKSSINCTFNVQQKTNAISRINSFENGFVVSEVFLAPESESTRLALAYSRRLSKNKYKFSIKTRGMLSTVARSPLTDIIGRSFRVSSGMSSLWQGPFNMNVSGSYQLSQQMQGTIDQKWNTWKVGGDLRYKARKWYGTIAYNWQINQLSDASIPLQLLNFRLDYHLNSWLTCSLWGQDVLNLGKSSMLLFNATPVFVEEAEFIRLQGSLMVGLKGSF